MSGPCVDDVEEDKVRLAREGTDWGAGSPPYGICRKKSAEKRESNTDNGEPEVEPGTVLVGASGVEEVFANRLATIALVQ